MKCQYRFAVLGSLKPDVVSHFEHGGRRYELVLFNRVLTSIHVTVPIPPEALPRLTQIQSAGVKMHLVVPTPELQEIAGDLRVVEGLLSLYGVQAINVQYPEVAWLPETSEERAILDLYEFKVFTKRPDPTEGPPVPLSFVVGAVLATSKAKEVDAALAFYRRGNLDMQEQRYIEAIYDFYFMLETLYGNGVFKKAQIIAAFWESVELQKALQTSLRDPHPLIKRDPKLATAFRQKYLNLDLRKVVEAIVELRGFLHHHTGKRKGIWHPEEQGRFELEALFLHGLCNHIGVLLFERYVTSEGAKSAVDAVLESARAGNHDS